MYRFPQPRLAAVAERAWAQDFRKRQRGARGWLAAFPHGDSSVRCAQLPQFKLPGSTGFEVCPLFIEIPIDAFEVRDFLPDFCHLFFDELGTLGAIDSLIPLRIQDLAYFR